MPLAESPRIGLLKELAQSRAQTEARMSAYMDGLEADVAIHGNYFVEFSDPSALKSEARILVFPDAYSFSRTGRGYLAICRNGFRALHVQDINKQDDFEVGMRDMAESGKISSGRLMISNDFDDFETFSLSVPMVDGDTLTPDLGVMLDPLPIEIRDCIKRNKQAEAARLERLRTAIGAEHQKVDLADQLLAELK